MQGRSQDFRKGGRGGAKKFTCFHSTNNFIALFIPSFWIYSATITTGLGAIIMVPCISVCLGLGWRYNYRGAYQSRYVMTVPSSYFHVILCCSWIPVLVSLS